MERSCHTEQQLYELEQAGYMDVLHSGDLHRSCLGLSWGVGNWSEGCGNPWWPTLSHNLTIAAETAWPLSVNEESIASPWMVFSSDLQKVHSDTALLKQVGLFFHAQDHVKEWQVCRTAPFGTSRRSR